MGIDSCFVIKLKRGTRAKFDRCMTRGGCEPQWLGRQAALVSTHLRHGMGDPRELREAFAEVFGEDLFAIHDDPRGMLAIDDLTAEAAEHAKTYDEAIAALGAYGTWLPLDPKGKGKPRPATPVETADPNASVEEQARQLNEQLGRSMFGPDWDGEYERDEDCNVCLLFTKKARFGSSNLAVNDVHKLDDGSRIVLTSSKGPKSFDRLERKLLSKEEELVSTHGDRRGVFAFYDKYMDLDAADYDLAIERVGERGRWLAKVPRSRGKLTLTSARRPS